MDKFLILTDEDIRKESFDHTPFTVPPDGDWVMPTEPPSFEDICKTTDEFHEICVRQTREALQDAKKYFDKDDPFIKEVLNKSID
jgi:hypothetical protein